MKSALILFFNLTLFAVFLVPAFLYGPLRSDEVEVLSVKAVSEGAGVYRFDVTLRHKDTGWEHYANKWEVQLPSGEVLATRVLHHPHVEEQPFTRSLGGVKVPHDVKTLFIQAYDTEHGASPKRFEVKLDEY